MTSVAFLGPGNAPKSLAAGDSPKTTLGRLQRSQTHELGLRGTTSKTFTSKGRGELKREERGGEGRGEKRTLK